MGTQSNYDLCPRCGKAISEDSKFCSECGERLYIYIIRCFHCRHDIIVKHDGLYITCPKCGRKTKSPNYEI